MRPPYSSVAVGVLVMAAPGLLGLGGDERMLAHILGPIVVALSVIALSGVTRFVRWAIVVPGVVLAILPWLLGFDTAVALMFAACGVAVALLAFVRGPVDDRYGGGWTALFRDDEPGSST
mgnify:FL=1